MCYSLTLSCPAFLVFAQFFNFSKDFAIKFFFNSDCYFSKKFLLVGPFNLFVLFFFYIFSFNRLLKVQNLLRCLTLWEIRRCLETTVCHENFYYLEIIKCAHMTSV